MKLVACLLPFLLSGCFAHVEIRHTEMTIIPLPERPALTGVSEQDVPILGSHAMQLRNLIIRYNEMAQEHNEKHGY